MNTLKASALLALTPLLLTPLAEAGAQHEDAALIKRVTQQLREAGINDPALVKSAASMAQAGSGLLYVVRGSDARVNRLVTGPVSLTVQGVPAQPVKSGAYDGNGHEKALTGHFTMIVDPVNDTGIVTARWTDSNGKWTYKRTTHIPPPHPTALRIAADATSTEFITDGVQTHGYQHGNTGAAGAVMPTIFQHIASFGPIEMTHNGQPFLNPFPGPSAPNWFGSAKVTDGLRDENDGTVRNSSGGIYSPMVPHDGVTDSDDLEIQLIMHTDGLPPGTTVPNFPSKFEFFYWVNFEHVSMRVLHL